MKFNLGEPVRIFKGQEQGEVIARAEYATAEPSYYIRYIAADGRATEAWWAESALQPVAEKATA